jgi:hypothetical protein
MRTVLALMLLATLTGCATEAVIKQVENTSACGAGPARLIPTESEVWLVLCQDGRVSWIEDEEAMQ